MLGLVLGFRFRVRVRVHHSQWKAVAILSRQSLKPNAQHPFRFISKYGIWLVSFDSLKVLKSMYT